MTFLQWSVINYNNYTLNQYWCVLKVEWQKSPQKNNQKIACVNDFFPNLNFLVFTLCYIVFCTLFPGFCNHFPQYFMSFMLETCRVINCSQHKSKSWLTLMDLRRRVLLEYLLYQASMRNLQIELKKTCMKAYLFNVWAV